MALKPTIYKLQLGVADSDRNHYQDYALTLAQHPSETVQRMLVRVLAFALNAHEDLRFTKGLSTDDEPDLWQQSLDGQNLLWIEVGQPKPERIKKALQRSHKVAVYPFGKTAHTWWSLEGANIARTDALTLALFDWQQVCELAGCIDRTMNWHVSIAGGELYVDTGKSHHQLTLRVL